MDGIGLDLSASFRDLGSMVRGRLGARLGSTRLCGVSISTEGGSGIRFYYSMLISTSGRPVVLGHGGGTTLFARMGCGCPIFGNRGFAHPMVINFNPTNVFYTLILSHTKLGPVMLRQNRSTSREGTSIRTFLGNNRLGRGDGIRFNRNNTNAFSSNGLGANVGSVEYHRILGAFTSFNKNSGVLCSTGPRVNASILVDIIGGVQHRVVGGNKRIQFGAQLRGVGAGDNGVISMVTNNGRVAYSGTVLTAKRDTHSIFSLLGRVGIGVSRGPFSVKIEVRRERRSVGGILCNGFCGRPTLSTTSCGLTIRLRGKQNICAFYVYPNNRIVGSSDRRNNLTIGNVDGSTHSNRGTGDTLLMDIRPRSLGDSSVVTNYCLRRGVRGGTCRVTRKDIPVAAINRLLGNRGSGVNEIGPAIGPDYIFTSFRDVFPGFVASDLGRTLPLFSEGVGNFTDDSTVLATPRAEDSSPVEVLQGSGCRDRDVGKLCPYNRKTNCTNKVVSTTISNVQITRRIVSSLGGGRWVEGGGGNVSVWGEYVVFFYVVCLFFYIRVYCSYGICGLPCSSFVVMWDILEVYGFVGGVCKCIEMSDVSRGRSERVLRLGSGNISARGVCVSGLSNGSFRQPRCGRLIRGLGGNSLLCILDVSELNEGCGRVLRR